MRRGFIVGRIAILAERARSDRCQTGFRYVSFPAKAAMFLFQQRLQLYSDINEKIPMV